MKQLDVIIHKEEKKYLKYVKTEAASHDFIVIYGAGTYGKWMYKYFKENGIPVKYFCVTKVNPNVKECEGLPIMSLDDIVAQGKKVFYLIAVDSRNNFALEDELKKRQITSYSRSTRFTQNILNNKIYEKALEITTKIGCTVNCKFCPQSVLLSKYQGKREMSFDDFKQFIDKTPEEMSVTFSGFVEPFLAKDTVQMMQYAHDIGRDIALHTTLVGLTKDKVDEIKHIPFTRLVVHVPDKNNYANIPKTEAHFDLLKYVMEIKRSDGSLWVTGASSQWEPDERACEIISPKMNINYKLHDRAGLLSGEGLRTGSVNRGGIAAIVRC